MVEAGEMDSGRAETWCGWGGVGGTGLSALAWLDGPDTKDCYRTWLLGAWAEEMASAELTLAVDLTTKLAWSKSAVRQGGDGG